jgi:hypothetical protein
VTDHFNVGSVEGRVIAPNFGSAISVSGPPRTFEMGLRLSF